MKALVLYGDYDLRYEDVPEPTLMPGHVKVRVYACGICGSDMPRITQGKAHYYPIILGHEFSGEVVAVAPDVTTHKVGDRIACAPLIPCGACPDCDAGHYSQCKNYSFIGSRIQGGLGEYVVIPATNAVRLEPQIPYAVAALTEPATVALHGIRITQDLAEKHVAVLGGGTIGIFALQWAKILGAASVTVFGRDQKHLELSKRLGADAVISTLDEAQMESVCAGNGGRGFDRVLECAGVSATMKLAFTLAANQAAVCMIGTPVGEISFTQNEWEQLNRKELKLTGSWMSGNAPYPGAEWTDTAAAFAEGKLKFDPEMIYKHIPFSDVETLLEILRDKSKIKGRIMMERATE